MSMYNKNMPFFLSLFFSRLGDQILLFIVPLVAYKVSGNASWSGLAFFLETLPRFLWFPIAGALCDRYSCLKLLRTSQLYRLIASIIFALILLINSSFYLLVFFSIICGVFSTQGFIARDIMLPHAFKNIRLDRSIANAQLADQVGTIAGPFIAGILLTMVDWAYVTLFVFVFFLVSDIFLRKWIFINNFVDDRPVDSSGGFFKSFGVAFKVIYSSAVIKKIITITFLSNLMLGVTLASAAVIVTGSLQLSVFSYGLLQSLGAVATILILLSISFLGFKARWLGLVGYVLMVIGFFLTGFIQNYVLYFVGFVLLIGFDKMFSVYGRYTRQRLIEDGDLGKASGFIVLFNNISQPIGGLIFSVVSLQGFGAIVNIVSAASVIIFLVLWPSIR